MLLVEADREVGGVWQRNKYPNLRLHAPGHSYRALSCAPAWQAPDQRSNESAAERMAYRPEQKEILAYIQSLVEHPKITLQTGTAFCYSEARAGSGFNARHRIVCARASGESYTSDVRAVVHCIGAYEVTAGTAPRIDPCAASTAYIVLGGEGWLGFWPWGWKSATPLPPPRLRSLPSELRLPSFIFGHPPPFSLLPPLFLPLPLPLARSHLALPLHMPYACALMCTCRVRACARAWRTP